MNPNSLRLLEESLKSYLPEANLSLIEKAYSIAEEAHSGQQRASGEQFLEHPFSVAQILLSLKMSDTTIAAALLHDVVEDTGITLEDIQREFGTEVASLVEGVTKIETLDLSIPKKSRYIENIRKFLISLSNDIRVVVIKFADRLHNLQTINYLEPEKQRRIALETIEVYAPLAHRLGIYQIKWQLEDMSFKILYPDKYEELATKVAKRRVEREDILLRAKKELEEVLKESGYKGEVQGRAKHFYSIHQKMQRESKDLDGIFDLFGLRIIIEGKPSDCYNILGLIHSKWNPIPQRFKDFITEKKSNEYQSLHTTVIGPAGEPIEIQIRTYEMHKVAEYGVAAHWVYKEGSKTDRDFSQKISWLRELIDWQKEFLTSSDFYEALKTDIFQEEVIVLTPKGDLITLPAGSTPLDFAYKIHTEIGHKCIGVKADGKMVPFDYHLKTGERVEILTSDRMKGPSRDWLDFVATASARAKIQQWFKKEAREEAVKEGKKIFERELKRAGYELEIGLPSELLDRVLKHFRVKVFEDLYHNLATGVISPTIFFRYIRKEEKKKAILEGLTVRPESFKQAGAAQVNGILMRLARCCSPLPGEATVGYITKGKGIAIHRENCLNIKRVQDIVRIIPVKWEISVSSTYPAKLTISAIDRPGLLADITQVLLQKSLNINQMRLTTTSSGKARISLEISLVSKSLLELVISDFLRIESVVEVKRI